jgi:uncharacterized protein
MYPFASLPENLAAFCDVLRRDYRFRIGPRELGDAARALTTAPIADERVVRDVLRPVLSHTLDDVLVFDRAFGAFFHPPSTVPRREPVSLDRPELESDAARTTRKAIGATAHAQSDPDRGRGSEIVGDAEVIGVDDVIGETAASLVRSSYSPLEADGVPPALVPPDAEWRGAARALVNRLQTGLSRRWRPAARGRRFDVRRTLRGSLHTGGEAVLPRWRSRVRRRPRFVVLVDGSRSMDAHGQRALQSAVALASATLNLEAFTFSTSLERVTRDVRRAGAGQPRRLPPLHHAWGGGTSIGGSLREFLRRFGDRLLAPDTVVIIASDGLDVGDPRTLRDAMARLHRQSAGIIWLNPLLETAGYEPTAQGMRVARPYVTTFAWVDDAAGLLRLSRTVRLRS